MNSMFIFFAISAIALLWGVALYNKFVRMINRAKEAWADIDVQLKRRYDLIPNLVNTVKGYAQHEKSAFENITKARASAIAATGVDEKAQAEMTLAGALKSVFAIAEAYPDLKANQNFLSLQEELTDTENKVQASRRFYNTNVRDLNTAVEQFPGSVVAGIFNFEKMPFFELGETDAPARNPVEVKF